MKQRDLHNFWGGTGSTPHATPNENDEVKWAQTPQGPVCGRDVVHASCYGCSGKLSFVKEHMSHRNGIAFPVRAFYRHVAKDKACTSESIAHRAAKHAIAEFIHEWKFGFKCVLCSKIVAVQVCCSQQDAAVQELAWGDYRLDVGVQGTGGVTGAVEVVATHALADDKAAALTGAGIAWCEVRAEDVLDAFKEKRWLVVVSRCSTDVCAWCEEQERSKAETELKNSFEATSTMEDRKRVKKRIFEQAQCEWRQSRVYKSEEAEKMKWDAFVKRLFAYAAKEAGELGVDAGMAQQCASAIAGGRAILGFGKHRGQSLEEVRDQDFPYLLWLAGYDWGKLDPRGRARKRLCTEMTQHIPHVVEMEAKDLISGFCFRCGQFFDYLEQEQWKTLCRECYKNR